MNSIINKSVFLLFIFATTPSFADVVYDSGSPNRPTMVTDLVFANGIFTANFDYGAAFGDTLLDQSVVTGSSDSDVVAALLSQLNSTLVDSNEAIAYVSVTDTEGLGTPAFFTGATVFDQSVGSGNWTSLLAGNGADSATTGANTALVTFSTATVPEPSSLICLAAVGMGLLCSRRRECQWC